MKIKYFTLNSLRHKDKPESRTKEKSPEKDKKTDSFGGRYKDRTKEKDLDSVAKAESEAQRRGYFICCCYTELNFNAERELRDSDKDARTVFAGNMPIRASEKELYEFFEKAGKVVDLQLISDRNSRKSKG